MDPKSELTVVNCFQQLLAGDPGFSDVVSAEELSAATTELTLIFAEIGTEALKAETRNVPLSEACSDAENYPRLYRVQTFASDILTHELPPNLQEIAFKSIRWTKKSLEEGKGDGIPAVLMELGRIAVNCTAAPVERALARVGMYQMVRVMLLTVDLLSEGEIAGLALEREDLDILAEEALAVWLEEAKAEGTDGLRLIEFSLADCLLRLKEHSAVLKEEIAGLSEDVEHELERRRKVMAQFQKMSRRDELLLRNLLAPSFGEQRVSIELLQKQHPDVLGDQQRSAHDKRLQRIKETLEKGQLPQRRTPSIFDAARAVFEESAPVLPSGEES